MRRRNVGSLCLSALGALVLLGGCFLVMGEIPEGSDTGSGGDSSSQGGSAGIGASGGSSGSSGSSGGGQGGVAGASGASGSAGDDAAGGAAGDAGSGGTAGAGGTGGCSSTCDCDGDQQAGPQCSGPDCMDDDPLVFQGQGGWFNAPNTGGNFDYNCSGTAEKEFPITNCGSLRALTACNTQPTGYYDSTKGCGDTVTLGKCIWMNLSCMQTVQQSSHTIRCH